MKRTTLAAALAVLIAATLALPAASARAVSSVTRAGVAPSVLAAAAAGQPVRVNVTLNQPQPAVPGKRSRPDAVRDIVRKVAAAQAAVLSRLAPADFTVIYRHAALPGLTGIVSPEGLAKLQADPDVAAVTEDLPAGGSALDPPARTAPAVASLGQSVPLIGADTVHAHGVTGAGVTVAILDSGADTDHPDLADSIVGQECYLTGSGSKCPDSTTHQSGPGAAEDDLGHGTNVTGIVTSNGNVSSVGVAPGASVLLYKVLNSSNTGLLSDFDAAFSDIIANHPEVKVINMSIGTFITFTGDCSAVDPTESAAINTLVSLGVTIFMSAGNNAAKNGMTFPACVPAAEAVGAVYDQTLASSTFFSCTDTPATVDVPTCWSNSASNLDLLGPGAFITSDGIGGGTSTYGGTSQASPHAAGVAALMLQHTPSLTPAQIDATLENTGVPRTDPANSITKPRIAAYQAVFSHAPLPVGGLAAPPDVAALPTRTTPRDSEPLIILAAAAAAIALAAIRMRRHSR
jgi:subtilisin family serine protease